MFHNFFSSYCFQSTLTLWHRPTSLTHWDRVTHLCVGNLIIIGSDNGLSPSRRKAIIWTNAGILWIEPLGTNFSDIFIEILTFSFKKMRLKVSSAKWRPFCLGLNVLKTHIHSCVATNKFRDTKCNSITADALLSLRPHHQQTWCWLCRISGPLTATRNDFNKLCHGRVAKCLKIPNYNILPNK